MNKFKVGDRVRYVGKLFPNRRDAIGTVKGFTFENDQAYVSWDDSPTVNLYFISSLEPIVMDSNNIKEFIQGIGAICETAGLLRTGFINNGFTREEAVKMASDYIITLSGLNPKGKEIE